MFLPRTKSVTSYYLGTVVPAKLQSLRQWHIWLGSQTVWAKSAMEILLYMFFVADEEGYLRKTNESGDMLQSKDIANECDISVSAVSKALSCWKAMNIVDTIDENGIKGIKFCNRMIFSIN